MTFVVLCQWYGLLLRLMQLGVGYDNLVQGLGNWFIDSSWYEAAKVPRFLAGNFAEVVFILCLLATHRRFADS